MFKRVFFYFIHELSTTHLILSCVISRSAPASPSHVGISGLMTPECLSREASPGPESYPDSSVPSPAGQLATSQSAPGSPGHPYTSSQSTHKGRLMQTIVTNGVGGDTGREGEVFSFFILLRFFCYRFSFEIIYNRSFDRNRKIFGAWTKRCRGPFFISGWPI